MGLSSLELRNLILDRLKKIDEEIYKLELKMFKDKFLVESKIFKYRLEDLRKTKLFNIEMLEKLGGSHEKSKESKDGKKTSKEVVLH
jgi:hypothetical protein